MKRALLLAFIALLSSGLSATEVTRYKLNPLTGKMDLITQIAPNTTPGQDYTGYVFDGENFCLYILGEQKECWADRGFLLNEASDYFLLEDGSRLRLE